MLSRRGLIGSLISLAAAPAIVRASSLMPVKVMEPTLALDGVPVEFDSFEFSGFYSLVPLGLFGDPNHMKTLAQYDIVTESICYYAR